MSTLKVSSIASKTGTGDITVPTGNRIVCADAGAIYSPGSVIQVIQSTFTTPTSVSLPNNAVAYTDIPNMFASITPTNSSSKIYVFVRWFGEMSPQTQIWNSMMGIKRNGTPVGNNPNTAGGAVGIAMPILSYYASDANSTPEQCIFEYLDSPITTNTVTYQLYANTTGAAATLVNNRSYTAAYEYGTSTITLWEIAQ